MSKKKLYLLDGMALAYRAHFAFIRSGLRNSAGIPTGPILGFANTLVKLLDEEHPTHISVVWDTHEPTFRHEMDEDYKANRPPQPEDLRTGIPLIKEMIRHFGIRNLEQHGYEADDIIGTLAHRAKEKDVNVFLVTPDKDFMQLVQGHITMVKPDNKNGGFNLIDPEGVKEYFGVYPEQVVDVLAFIGDTSDNIPGVPGIGKKGAPNLVKKYGSLEKAIEAAPEIKSKRQREGLLKHGDKALHAKKMVKIKTDVPDVVNWEELEWHGENKKELGFFFKQMEFRTLTRKYLMEEGPETDQQNPDQAGQAGQSVQAPKKDQAGTTAQPDLFAAEAAPAADEAYDRYDKDQVDYQVAVTETEIRSVVDELQKAERLCFDTETDSGNPERAKLVGISLSVQPGMAWYIPVNVERALSAGKVCELLQPLFESDSVAKIAHHFKYDYVVLGRHGLKVTGEVFDTMVAAYLLDAGQKLTLDSLAKKYLNYESILIEELIGTGRKKKSMAAIPYEDVVCYACEDADVTLKLYEVLVEKLKEDELLDIAYKVDFPLIQVLGDMEITGIKLDTFMLALFSDQLDSDLKEIEEKIFNEAGEEFNLNSPQQLGEVLFEKMKIPSGKKTKTGQYSTAESVLAELANEYPVPGRVLDYRSLSKLKSTYADALPKLVNKSTGRIHTSFNQTVAATGRLSSSNPNLQNIPVRTQRGREIRKAFVPEEGYRILAADYSQVELRVIASISQDKNMTSAFVNNQDIHARTAMEIFSLDNLEEVTADHRRKAKEVNFGIPYGVSAYGLASRLGISNGEGKEMIDQYFKRFPGIGRYITETKNFVRENGYVKTLMGRRRYIPDIHSRNWNVRSFAERTAINMPIQGTAADIIKVAMIQIHQFLADENIKSRMLLQVHDELVFEIHEEEMDDVSEEIRNLMVSAAELEVPLKVDMGIADNWLEAH